MLAQRQERRIPPGRQAASRRPTSPAPASRAIEPGSAQLCFSGSSRPGIATSADRTPRRCARLAHSWNGRPGEGLEKRPLHRLPKPRGPAALGAVAERVADTLLAGAVAPAALTAVGCRPSSRPAACAGNGRRGEFGHSSSNAAWGRLPYGRQPRDRVDPHRRISSLTWSSTTGGLSAPHRDSTGRSASTSWSCAGTAVGWAGRCAPRRAASCEVIELRPGSRGGRAGLSRKRRVRLVSRRFPALHLVARKARSRSRFVLGQRGEEICEVGPRPYRSSGHAPV